MNADKQGTNYRNRRRGEYETHRVTLVPARVGLGLRKQESLIDVDRCRHREQTKNT
ncbi:MAG: hypothetical protein QM770_18500 [Tepidisphaeraceae bacterium]